MISSSIFVVVRINHFIIIHRDQVLPRLEESSVVVMDKAPYHMRIAGTYYVMLEK